MNNELKYIFKGVLYTCALIAVIYISYYIISYQRNKAVETKPPVITYDELINTPEVSEGKVLFDKNCSACHKLYHTEQNWSHDIVDNSYDKKALYGWIRNSDSVIKSGNEYYNAVFNENNKVQMTSFPNLTDEEIDHIIDYIKVENAFKR
jgi:mono/diheme cytochrome c family protein